ncbi:hypothetical protein JFU18_22345 [Bacillus sp. TH22]|jgi:hypothetical protein|uniref:Uncharacterized protein n=2 Tax=Bacillus TaxID=1386 RepID=A0A653PQF9_BACMY|nr:MULTISPECIES: hypothetical protein [Bacillus]EJQ67276.1 hypothetical protein IG7_03912 [Bacillus cereus HuA2-4]MBK5451244.1 hypothetical protein [Bacillus sp. TH22]MCQ6564415.1 hypothetical protein [Bacillus mycoides]MED1284451.1 hypothetical protein [Bacillus mycoides]QWH62529.1 hypothetical protein EXW39_21035 [Bacillus mycoides]
MGTYFNERMNNRNFYFSLMLGIALSCVYILYYVIPLADKKDVIFTPYTTWMGINSIVTPSFLFFFILPVIASLPSSSIFQEDKKNGSFLFVIIRSNYKMYFLKLFSKTFFIGGFVVIIPLILNIFLSFMFLPNVNPDEVLNSNIGMYERATFFINIYFTHPFIHMMLYTVIAFVYGGAFALFSLSMSFYAKHTFVTLLSAFLLQLFLMIINLFYPMPLAPIYFLSESHIYHGANIIVSILVLIGIFILSIILFLRGVKRHVIL